jgi:hypothetical protein
MTVGGGGAALPVGRHARSSARLPPPIKLVVPIRIKRSWRTRPSRPLAAARAPQAGLSRWRGLPHCRLAARPPAVARRPHSPESPESPRVTLAVGGSLSECTAPGPAFCESNVSVSCNDRLVVPVAVQGQRRNSESPRRDYMGQCPCRRAPSSVHGLHGEPPQMRGKGRYRYRALGAVMGRSSKP